MKNPINTTAHPSHNKHQTEDTEQPLKNNMDNKTTNNRKSHKRTPKGETIE
jgi:BRCT domain type II-containing protein